MSRAFKIAVAVVTIPLIALLLAGFALKLYVSSDSFARLAESMAHDSFGAKLELSDAFQIKSVFPQLKIHSTRLALARDEPSRQVRLRAKKVTVSMPFMDAVWSDLNAMSISVDAVTAVFRDSADTEIKPDNNGENAAAEVARNFELLGELYSVTGQIEVKSANIIYRPHELPSQRFQIDNIRFLAESGEVHASGDYVATSILSQPVDIRLKRLPVAGGYGVRFSVKAVEGLDRFELPSDLSGTLTLAGSRLRIDDVRLDYARNQVRAQSMIKLDERIYSGLIDVRRFEVSEVFPEKSDSTEAELLFGKEPFGFASLSDLDIKIKVRLGAVRYNNRPLASGSFLVTSKNNELDVISDSLQILGASANFELLGSNLVDGAVFETKLAIDKLNLRRFYFDKERGGQAIFTEGISEFDANLNFSGNSPRRFAESLSGSVRFAASASEMSVYAVRFVDKSLLSYTRLGFSKRDQEETDESVAEKEEPNGLPIHCINVHFAFDNGYAVADQTILIETRDNTMSSTAYLDFHKEVLGFRFTTDTKRFIDWSPLSLIKYLEIDGAIPDPSFALNKFEVAKKGLVTVASFFLGPIPSLALSALEASHNYAQEKPICVPYIPN